MPKDPNSLPPQLGRTFSVAQARASGATAARLRALDLTSPFHGVRVRGDAPTLRDRCDARASRMPTYAAFSHSTAAALHALPLPRRLVAPDARIRVSVPAGASPPGGRGTSGHELDCRPDEADARLGILCTTPARTFCDLATQLSLAELVAVGDAILQRRLATREEIAVAVDRAAGRRGCRRLRRAYDLIDARAESPKESELRVLLAVAGLPRPEVNLDVRDHDGRFADLARALRP